MELIFRQTFFVELYERVMCEYSILKLARNSWRKIEAVVANNVCCCLAVISNSI